MTSQPAPHHIALIMDGNGRWAKKKHFPRLAGHRAGATALRKVVSHCIRRGVRVLTVFAFSSENWQRPTEEVSGLMGLLTSALSKEVPELEKAGVQLHFVGQMDRLSAPLQSTIARAQGATSHNERLVLNVCLNYGGRWEIAQAATRVMAKGLPMTEQNLSACMALAHVPEPDLLIRTGGECRISNFLLWQIAYAELHFSPVLWPDFDEAALDVAIEAYQTRERRFGKTSEQLGS